MLDITFEMEDIYVISVDGKVVKYALVKDYKVISLIYFRKGSQKPGFFVPYWLLFTDEEKREINEILKEEGSSGDEIKDLKIKNAMERTRR